MQGLTLAFIAILSAGTPVRADVPVVLRGSPESMKRQNEVAREHGYSFARTLRDVYALVEAGELVPLGGNRDYAVAAEVQAPLARPELRLFIERLAQQYRAATGEKLVVTSVLRPVSRQPANAHPLSVHPAGIAVDLRVSARAKSRAWLERTLLSLEREGLLDATREYRPPHYHVALFPQPYVAHVARLMGEGAKEEGIEPPPPSGLEVPASLDPAPLSAGVGDAVADLGDLSRPADVRGWFGLLLLMVSLALLPTAFLGRRTPR